MTAHSEPLQQLPFEDILPSVADFTKTILVPKRPTLILYREIKQKFRGLKSSFHIERLAAEFDESHREVQLQPVKNKQLTRQHMAHK